ncbi:MAG: hypothetical protein MRZ67_02055 [Christensenella sp.]|jgi:hypothetical protein|nr:hypothetical protein [Christensenella sp.]
MEEGTCKTCRHFRQHYVKIGKSYHACTYGHCVYPRCKVRDRETPACKWFREKLESQAT